ncbi:MAG: hypothetical protein LBT76_04515 [Tannerella sp.]|jgi:hypothetical protein|nr:hypothetical protein [Tannerella sp.]
MDKSNPVYKKLKSPSFTGKSGKNNFVPLSPDEAYSLTYQMKIQNDLSHADFFPVVIIPIALFHRWGRENSD